MPVPRVFISFDFDNNQTEILLFAGQAKNYQNSLDIADWSSKTRLSQKEQKTGIENKITWCNMLIALVGKKTHLSVSVEKEISIAITNEVPVFGVYVDLANATTPLPGGLDRKRTIVWDWKNITSWINQCMKEGKNK